MLLAPFLADRLGSPDQDAAFALAAAAFHLYAAGVSPFTALVQRPVHLALMATLGFLGVGVPLTKPSLGMMISIGKNYIYVGMWWMIVFPGAALIFLVVGINLFADWLREELNPKIERSA